MSIQAISIHAPTKGATNAVIVSKEGGVNFNPRSHEGSDFVGGGDKGSL